MSAITDTLKRAPKWSWYIAGGVGLGAVAIRFYQGRDADDPNVEAGDGTTVGDSTPGTVTPGTTGSSPPGVIVPPIITGGDGGSIGELGAAFAGLVGGTITDLTGLVGMQIDANAANNAQWIGAFGESNASWVNAFGGANSQWIDALAAAGQAPAPVAQTPTPVIVNVAAPPSAPVASPPSAPKPPDPCTGEYPFQQDSGPRKGQCYKVVKKDGKTYRYYKNGDKVLA